MLELLDNSEIHGVQDVLKDVLGFAEDVVHMCHAIEQKKVERRSRGDGSVRQTPDLSGR